MHQYQPIMTGIQRFYDDVAALKLHKTQYSFVFNDFNAKIERESVGMTAIGNFVIDTQNDSDEMLVRFA